MDLPKLLVVEDDDDLRAQMRWALSDEYQVLLAHDGETGLAVWEKERPPIVTLDLGLPPCPADVSVGFSLLSSIIEREPLTKVIVITGRDEREHGLRAISQGAYNFLYKPVQIDDLKVFLRLTHRAFALESENRELLRRLAAESPFEELLGCSPQMQKVFETIRKIATTDAQVLIEGESGTGKELTARAIHDLSAWKAGPFVAINCSAIPETLLESELFGHEKGSFTGAHASRRGRIENAQGGTLFLDEIGELSLPLQVKLLRFLQEQKIERVGGREEIAINARVVAATNKDLRRATSEGQFREDLYYRLEVVRIVIPPLRERHDDIVLLAKFFLHRYAVQNNKNVSGFSPKALTAMTAYPWLGNVRELENKVKRAVIMSDGRVITPEDLDLTSQHHRYVGKTLQAAREELEREMVDQAILRSKGNLTKAAAELGVTRPTLYDLMARLGLRGKEIS